MTDAGELAVRVERLSRHFGKVVAVDGISFSVGRGEIYGLVGPDGAGKTTTMRMIAGLVRPTSGEVAVHGHPPFGRGAERVREMVGLVPQEHSLYGDLSIDENLSFFAALYGLGRREFPERRARLLEITRLSEFGDRRAAQLSGGMYKKLSLACALLHRPEVLLLDEPTNGVDPVSRRELWALLYEFVASGTTIVVTTPYMDEAVRCHRVALMHRGHIVREGTPEALMASLPARVFEVVGEVDREALHAVLAHDPAVVAASPAGARIRVVVEPDGVAALEATLRAMKVSLTATRPDFEDVFLYETRRHDAERRAA